MASEELKKKLCEQCNKQFSDEPCEPSECRLLAVIENAVEIPDCSKCAYNAGIAYWHQCENCLGQARNNFLSISEINHEKTEP